MNRARHCPKNLQQVSGLADDAVDALPQSKGGFPVDENVPNMDNFLLCATCVQGATVDKYLNLIL